MKTKIILSSALLFLSALLYAGDTTQTKPFKRFYIGASFTPNVTYRYLRQDYVPGNSTPAAEKEFLKWRNKHEHPQIGFHGGIRLGVNVARFMSIETGVEYNLHRYLMKADTSASGSLGSNLINKLTYNYHYLNIPVALNFRLGKKKLKGIISAGASFQFLLRKKNTMRLYNGSELVETTTVPDVYPFKTFNISPFLGIGLEYHVSRSLFLRIMPIVHMQALKNVDAPITEHLWSAGINAALFFGFKKVK